MAINLMPYIKQQYFDNNGSPLSGGQLYSYVAGTVNNPADTYTDSTGGTLNTNPIILDERGEADIWLSSALKYKFVLKAADGSTIYTVDNVSSGSGAGGSSGGELVKVSAADIAAQYLEDKLVAGQDISIKKLNTGAVEQLEIASTIDVSKFVTVDTEQLGLTGNKEWNSNHTFNKGLLLNGGWFAGSQGTGEPYLLFDHNAYSYMAKTNAGIKIVTSEPSVNNVSLNVGVNSGIVSFESVSAGSGNFFASNFTSAEGDDRNASQSYAGINAAIQGGNSSYLYAYSGNDLVGSKIEAKADTIDLIGTTYIDTTTGTATKLIAKEADGKLIEVDLIDSSVTLQDAYNNSLTEPEILTDATRGAVTIKNGINNEALKVLEVQNFAGNNTAAFTGAGQLQLDSPNIQPQIVFDSNGGVDLDHYIQYNPGGVGGITIKSQQAASEVTTLELNRNSSGEFKLSGNSSDTTKSAQLINTYSVPSDEAYLQLISRNDKTATKTATITVASGSTDLAKDSEISLSAEKINTFSASVIGRDPVASNEFATKNYTDSAIGLAVVGSAVYKGTWNASTNTPDLTSVAKAQADFYIVSVAGTTSIDGINEWSVGDWILFNGTDWEKVDNSQTIPVNVGTGAQVFKSLNAVSNQADFRTLVGGSIISLTQNADDITINDSNVAGVNISNTFTQDQTINGDLNITASTKRIKGGFGTVSTAGVLDWDDVSNSTSGSGYTLLTTTATNSPQNSGINYWYPFTFEHTKKDGSGNRTQLAIPYGNLSLLGNLNYRSYYNTGWTGWREIIATKEDSRDVDFQGVVNLSSTTNGSPGNGDIWYDGDNLIGVEDSTSFNLSGLYGTSADTDLNNYTQDGKYLTPSTALTNAPAGFTTSSRRLIQVSQYALGTSNYIIQTLYSINDNKVAWRVYATASWSEWHEVPYMVDDVLKLQSTTNGSATTGNIWYDGTNVNVQGDVVIDTSTTESALKFQRSNINNWWIRSRSTNTLRFSSYDEATGSFLNSPIELMPFELALNGKIGLNSYTNGSPTNGDIWLDSTSGNLTLKGDAELTDNVILSRASSTTISRDETSGFVSLAGGTSASKGAEVLLYGSSAGSVVGRLRINSTTQALFDADKFEIWKKLNLKSATNASPATGDIWYDGGYYNFYDRLKLYDTSLHRDTNSSFLILGGGGTSSNGANIVLYGSDSLNKGVLRNGSTEILEWDSNGVTINSKHIVNRLSKTITLENPTAADTIPIFRTDKAITIDKISYEIIGSTNCIFDIEWGNNAGGAGTVVTSSPMTANATQAETTTFSDPTIGANNYLQLDVNSISGTPDYITVTIHYTMDAND